MIHRAKLEQDENGFAADSVSELTERPDATGHAQNRHRRPHAGLGEAEAEALCEIARHPNHDPVIGEVFGPNRGWRFPESSCMSFHLSPASETSFLF
jgi:hypothetical protein